MCNDVWIHGNGAPLNCPTQGELQKELGELVLESGYAKNAFTDEMCLCPIDLEVTAAKHGYTMTHIDPTTGVSCVKLGRKFQGIEIDERFFDLACRRIEAAVRQPDMFLKAEKQPQFNLTPTTNQTNEE